MSYADSLSAGRTEMPRINAQMKKPVRLEQRVGYRARHLPAITPYLKRMGLHAWVTDSEARRDCTGREKIGRGRRFGLTAESLADDQALARQKRILQKVCYEL